MPRLEYRFGPFRLDVAERRLSQEDRVIPLRGKVFDTLCVLVEKHGRLVRKDDIMKAVWPDSIVEENNLDHNISALRKTLEKRGGVKYIETVPRQGYRFIAPLDAPNTNRAPVSCLIEREEQLSYLRASFELARSGTRQIVFITGEAGIGKTTLVRAFVEGLTAGAGARVASGDCLNSHGASEPYLPVLDALSRLAREEGALCVDVLARCAPSWLAQMPSVAGSEQARSTQAMLGITAERMIREMADALEVLTAELPLILILEDLHWADASTVDLLARVAVRTDPARLLVLGTYRPSDAKARSHPLHAIAQQLKLRGCSQEIAPGLLTEDGVAKYLHARFVDSVPSATSQRLYARTQGNPLFVTTVVNSWLAGGALPANVEDLSFSVPDDLRQLIEQQVLELDDSDQQIVQAASVAGASFCPAAIAPALERNVGDVEARCAALAKAGCFFVSTGAHEWPDGTVCEGYSFLHSVHRDVTYERLPAGRRVRLHQQIGMAIEQGHHGDEDAVTSELAVHFREARDAPRALHYLQRSAELSLKQSAHLEAIVDLKSAVEMLRRLPDLEERDRRELELLSLLAPALMITRGFADPEAEHAFRRAYELSSRLECLCSNFPVVFGLGVMLEIRGHYPKAQQLMERHLPEQERRGDFMLEARDLLACSRFHQGAFADALDHGDKGAQAYSPERHSQVTAALGEDPGIGCRTWAALSLWFLGYPDRALAEARLAVALAQDPSRLYSLANAQIQLAMLHQLRQEEEQALHWANQAIAIANQQGYPYRRAAGQVLRGWALARCGECEAGVRELEEGISGCAAIGAELDRPYHLALLAEAQLMAGRPGEAVALLDHALTHPSAKPSFFYLAELYRLRGVVAIECSQTPADAAQWIARALEVASSQAALSLELRSALDLSRIERARGEELLADTYARFREGFETPDLLKARDVLA